MLLDVFAGGVVVLAIVAFGYHHFVYPVLLGGLASRRRWEMQQSVDAPFARNGETVPSVTLIVPAYNEMRFIAEKVRNLAALDYPSGQLAIVLALDGCTDETERVASEALKAVGSPSHIQLRVHHVNRGKLALLNEEIALASGAIVALSDASAMLAPDALLRSTRHFDQPDVGVVCPTYRLSRPRDAGEAAYWTYQTRIKASEARIAAPMGAHGAFYLFRRAAWKPLPYDTINDDFVLPMRIVADGYRAIYDESVVAIELEETGRNQDFGRRVRIGAGNMQQIVRLAGLGRPGNGWLAFVFLSGKGLRPLISILVAAALICSAYLSWRGYVVFQAGLAAATLLLAVAAAAVAMRSWKLPKSLEWLSYLVEGHTASLVGAARYFAWPSGVTWSRPPNADDEPDYMPWSVRVGKRCFDLVCVFLTLAFLGIFFLPLAIAIKLDSRGPIFYRQLRVGYCRPNVTRLFYVIKFRTMREDAEVATGAVWATKDDPRVTRIGRFLRKTRIDELPQVFNVLAGDMSFVGPRPERPKFVDKLDMQIPFYLERNFYMMPGITGLAQVNQGYDDTIDDVRRKVLFDHAYAARLSNFTSWLKADIEILFDTVRVMVLGHGR